jgi:hypothetical protein
VCGGSTPPGAIPTRTVERHPHGYAGQVGRRCRKCSPLRTPVLPRRFAERGNAPGVGAALHESQATRRLRSWLGWSERLCDLLERLDSVEHVSESPRRQLLHTSDASLSGHVSIARVRGEHGATPSAPPWRALALVAGRRASTLQRLSLGRCAGLGLRLRLACRVGFGLFAGQTGSRFGLSQAGRRDCCGDGDQSLKRS